MKHIAILASHNGSKMDAIYKACRDGIIDANIALVISNNTNAPVLQKAQSLDIPNYCVNAKNANIPDETIGMLLTQHNCTLVVLAGYMKKLSTTITEYFQVINSHPSLLPKYGGKGMYGRFVHEAVLKNAEKESGITIHEVNEAYDEGAIILQRSVAIGEDETVESLERKIKALEQEAIIEALQQCLK